MRTAIVWATGLPGLFVVVPLLTWGLVRVGRRLSRMVDAEWEAQIADHREQTRALRAVHGTPGGLGDDRGAS